MKISKNRISFKKHFEQITHFEKSALNLGPNQRTLNFFQSALNLGPT